MKIKLIADYIQGTLRYNLYNSKLKFLIRKHIVEQYEWRLSIMNKECYENGSCIKCGCNVPELQFCNKSCDGNCYPVFYNKKFWKLFKKYILCGKTE